MIVIPYFYETARAVYGLERPVKIGANMYGTAKKLILVYLLLTLVGFLSFMATGLTTFDAITHVMTAIATGGMSTYDEGYSVIYRASPNSAFPFMTIMIPGAFNFVVLYELVTGNVREVIRSAFYILEGRGFVEGVFNQVSGMTTTGFNIGSLSDLRDFTKSTLIIGIFLGGMTFSTAGGIKALKLILLIKKLSTYTEKVMLPPSVVKADEDYPKHLRLTRLSR
jgi:trk system potassium uptake protein TrkH